MSTLIHTLNDLSEETRLKIIEMLNQSLADGIDLQLQIKQAHWNVKGADFIGVHELLDKIADALREDIDEIAERVAQLGGVAEGTVQRVQVRTHLPEYPLDIHKSHDHLKAVAAALANFGRHLRKSIAESAEKGDADTSDLYTQVSRVVDKNLWFIESFLYRE
jgi:starvation-inducible DNA-binding protein